MNPRERTFVPEEPLGPEIVDPAHNIAAFLPSAARLTPVTQAMVRTVVCVGPDMNVSELMWLFVERGISGAPVVNPDGKPIGVVSKTDILRELCENPDAARRPILPRDELDADQDLESLLELYPGRLVRHIMTPLAIVVGEDSSLARAAAVMAYERVHRVIVADRAGNVVGLLSAIDVLRWLGRRDGYAIP